MSKHHNNLEHSYVDTTLLILTTIINLKDEKVFFIEIETDFGTTIAHLGKNGEIKLFMKK